MITEESEDEFSETLDRVDWNSTFEREILDAAGQSSRFRDLLKLSAEPEFFVTLPAQLLIVFIRHFFCGNCQEYLRRLVAEPCFSHHLLAERNIRVVIIGCGASSLIPSYREVTDVPSDWQIYTDPTAELHRLLGMHRTLSLGKRSPRYIQRSLTSGMLSSIVQGIKRLPEGDMTAAGSLSVNGGELLFTLNGDAEGHSRAEDWKLNWCHRMRNSRDHTEVDVLLQHMGLSSKTENVNATLLKPLNQRTQSAPLVASNARPMVSDTTSAVIGKPDSARSTLRRSFSKRRQSWFGTAERFVRSDSKRRSMTIQLKDSNTLAAAVLTRTD